jgi:hypothetical protein
MRDVFERKFAKFMGEPITLRRLGWHFQCSRDQLLAVLQRNVRITAASPNRRPQMRKNTWGSPGVNVAYQPTALSQTQTAIAAR